MVKLVIVALFLVQLGCVLQAVQASHYIQFRANNRNNWVVHVAGLCIHDGDRRLSTEANRFNRGIDEYKFDSYGFKTSVWWNSWGDTGQTFMSGCWDTTDKICGTAKEEKAKRDCDFFMESYVDNR
ncbi:hypothetical protein BGX23_006124 [Mortierella sp. AD031]|nr:hypothetical protein BGX23_006124 [Mortierella sp. AD031]